MTPVISGTAALVKGRCLILGPRLRCPGADHHPHGWAGARGECQDLNELSSW